MYTLVDPDRLVSIPQNFTDWSQVDIDRDTNVMWRLILLKDITNPTESEIPFYTRVMTKIREINPNSTLVMVYHLRDRLTHSDLRGLRSIGINKVMSGQVDLENPSEIRIYLALKGYDTRSAGEYTSEQMKKVLSMVVPDTGTDRYRYLKDIIHSGNYNRLKSEITPRDVSYTASDGYTLLKEAVHIGSVGMAKILIQNGTIISPDILQLAIERDKYPVASLLVKYGADLSGYPDDIREKVYMYETLI